MKKRPLLILLGIFGGIFFSGIAIFLFYVAHKSPSYNSRDYDYAVDSFTEPTYLHSEKSMEEESYALRMLDSDQMMNNQGGSKVQKNGQISFLVEKIDDSIDALKEVNGAFGGIITNIYDSGRGNDRSVQITVRIPVEKFESFYNDLRKMEGEVTYANVSTLDVTEEYIDITSRLSNLKSTETQLIKILEKAENVTDILAVQKELNTVRGDIESYEQRKRYFDSQTDYSYITISFSIDKTGLNIAEDEWKPWGEVKAAVKSLISVLKGFVNLLIWIAIFSPIILVPFFLIRYLVRRKKTNK